MKIELVTHKGCPICVMTEKVLQGKTGISITVHGEDDPKSQLIVDESKLTSFPIIKVDGKFYSGNDALKFVRSL